MSADDLLAYNPADVKPGWVAFGIVVALCVATFLLWRSMNTQLGRIRMPPRPSTRPGIGPSRAEPPAAPLPPQASTGEATAHPRDDDL
jgi:hypothetical protein